VFSENKHILLGVLYMKLVLLVYVHLTVGDNIHALHLYLCWDTRVKYIKLPNPYLTKCNFLSNV